MRLSRESVWTAARPTSVLSTYIVCSNGWSKPVWNFSATISTRYSELAELAPPCCDSGKPFMFDSVSGLPVPSSTVPEKATSALMSA